MASSNHRNYVVRQEPVIPQPYFIITATNYPNLLQRTRLLQELPEQVT